MKEEEATSGNIIINGKEYDLDGAFDKDEDAGAALYEIDALIGDLVCDFGMKCEQILKLIEKEIKKLAKPQKEK